MQLDEDLVVPNKKLSIDEGAIAPYQRMSASHSAGTAAASARSRRRMGFTLDGAARKPDDDRQWQALMHGTGDEVVDEVEFELRSGRVRKYSITWEGVMTNLERRYKETDSDWVRSDIERYMVAVPCPDVPGRAPQARDDRRHRRRTSRIARQILKEIAGA
jgi:excinuclease ABC subunit A